MFLSSTATIFILLSQKSTTTFSSTMGTRCCNLCLKCYILDVCSRYPLYCVLTGPPEAVQIRANSTPVKEALALFLKSLKEASLVIFGQPFSRKSPESVKVSKRSTLAVGSECEMVKSYMDVVSMRAVNSSKLKKDVKVTRKKEGDMSHQIKKVYPKIPTGVKRSISSSEEPSSSAKKSRPGFKVDFD